MPLPQNEVGAALRRCIELALGTSHLHLAQIAGAASRYPSDVAPFGAVRDRTPQAMDDLASLLPPGDSLYLMGEYPMGEHPLSVPPAEDANLPANVSMGGGVTCLQMVWPAALAISPPGPAPTPGTEIVELDCTHADEMVQLITLAFPGYFRPGTCRMGKYFGIRDRGRLIAMGGERLIFDHAGHNWREISGLCTHPDFTGKGLATALLLHILRKHRASGALSWLHVTDHNHRAIALYHHLGFQTVQTVHLRRVERSH